MKRSSRLLSPLLLLALILAPSLLGLAQEVAAPAAVVVAAADPPGAAIASAHELTTEAGLHILRQGGNAFDAAIAVSSVLSVVEPISSGLGGGGFFLLHDASTARDVFVDARETAPAAATPEEYLLEDGSLNRDRSVNGPWSAGIPGLPAAFVHLAQNYGKLPLTTSLAPAIRIAREGFPVYERMSKGYARRREVMERSEQEAAAGGRASSHVWGNLQTVMWDKRTDTFFGGSDPRNPVGAARILPESEAQPEPAAPAARR